MKNKYPLQAFVKITAFPFLLIFLRPKITYHNGMNRKHIPKTGFIVCSNHTGILDVGCITAVFGLRVFRAWVAEILYAKGKLFSCFLNKIGCIYVNRNKADTKYITEAIESVTAGNIMIVFPEGKLSTDREIHNFKPGATIVAERTGAPIIPICIYRKDRRFSRTEIAVGTPLRVCSTKIIDKDYLEFIDEETNSIRATIIALKKAMQG